MIFSSICAHAIERHHFIIFLFFFFLSFHHRFYNFLLHKCRKSSRELKQKHCNLSTKSVHRLKHLKMFIPVSLPRTHWIVRRLIVEHLARMNRNWYSSKRFLSIYTNKLSIFFFCSSCVIRICVNELNRNENKFNEVEVIARCRLSVHLNLN